MCPVRLVLNQAEVQSGQTTQDLEDLVEDLTLKNKGVSEQCFDTMWQ